MTLTALFVFLAWLAPTLAGAVVGIGGPTSQERACRPGASPVSGIALSSGVANPPGIDTIQLAAIAPPITFAFLFNYLLVITQRTVDRNVRAKLTARPAEGDGEPNPSRSRTFPQPAWGRRLLKRGPSGAALRGPTLQKTTSHPSSAHTATAADSEISAGL